MTRYRSVVAEERFDVLFDGPAVRDGRISADTLASSLLALSAAAQAAHLAISPLSPRITLDIQASREGSFSVDLLITDTVDILTSQPTTALLAAGSIVTIVFGAIKGSARALKWLHGRTLGRVTDLGDGQTRLTDSNGDSIVIDSPVYIAIQDRTFRESMRDVVAPVSQEGIDFVEIGQGVDRERVTAEDLPAFEVPSDGEVLRETSREAFLQLINVSFQPNTKWRFTEGDAPFWAAMTDRAFALRVQNHEVEFGKGDILRATLETTQTRSGTNLRVEHAVSAVHEILKQGRQVELPFDDNDETGADG